MINFQKKQLSS
jgi:hypothetical protein